MKSILSAAVAAALSVGLAAPAAAQEVKLRAATFVPANTAFGAPFKRWADEVNKRGKGLVQIDVLGPEAVPTAEQPNAVKTGVLDMHSGPPTFYRGTLVEAEALTLSEFGVPELRKNGAWDLLNKLHTEKMNVMLLTGFGDGVSFHIYTNKPVGASKERPLDGMVMRSTPNYKAFFESLGAKAVSIVPGEVFTALERNMVQGYGWPLWGPNDMGWLKHTKFRYDPGFYNVSVNIMMNADRWKKLDKKQQDFLMQMAFWMDEEWPKWRAEAEGREEKIQRDQGVQVVNLGADLRRRAHEAFWADIESGSPQNVRTLRGLMTKK
jgi:TRAP-type C4-dicarboxylate transport system substrate-binding protein